MKARKQFIRFAQVKWRSVLVYNFSKNIDQIILKTKYSFSLPAQMEIKEFDLNILMAKHLQKVRER